MSYPEIVVLSICVAVPLLVLSLFAIYKKNKRKIAEKKAKENVKLKTDEEKELDSLKKQIEFEKKYEEEKRLKSQNNVSNSSAVGESDDEELDKLLKDLEDDKIPPVPKFEGITRPERPNKHFSSYDYDDKSKSEEETLKEEIDNMSPKMKAILFADLMKPKYKD